MESASSGSIISSTVIALVWTLECAHSTRANSHTGKLAWHGLDARTDRQAHAFSEPAASRVAMTIFLAANKSSDSAFSGAADSLGLSSHCVCGAAGKLTGQLMQCH